MRTLQQLQSQIALISPGCSVEPHGWSIRVQLRDCVVPLEFELRPDHPDSTLTSPSGDILAPLRFKVSVFLGNCPQLDATTATRYANEVAQLAALMAAAQRVADAETTYALIRTGEEDAAAKRAAHIDGVKRKEYNLCVTHTKGLRVGQALTSTTDVSLAGTREYVIKTRNTTKTFMCTSELGVTTVRRTA